MPNRGTKRPRVDSPSSSFSGISSPVVSTSTTPSTGAVKPNNKILASALLAPIKNAGWDLKTLPDAAQLLVAKAQLFAKGVDTVPADIIDDSNSSKFLSHTICVPSSSFRTSLGGNLRLSKAHDIASKAHDLTRTEELEPRWNDIVNKRLLDTCVKLSIHKQSIKSANVTQNAVAKLFEPKSTLSRTLESKKVDFVYCLKESESMEAARQVLFNFWIEKGLHESPLIHYNDNTHQGDPTAVSFEVKRNLEDTVQLKYWVSAHFNFLQTLAQAIGVTETELRLPALPLVLIHGSTWDLYVADRSKGPNGWATDFHKIGAFGDVAKEEGVYQVVAVLLLLIDYAQKTIRPWIEDLVARVSQVSDQQL